MTIKQLLADSTIHPSWQPILLEGLEQISPTYLQGLLDDPNWLPGKKNIFNAFSIPLERVNYILFGESPYPRPTSANGFAFWDSAVTALWSESGLAKPVNRATSLRTFIKMLLVTDLSQEAIAKLDKTHLVKTITELFTNMLDHGFLLLNTTLVLRDKAVAKEAKQWHPLIQKILYTLKKKRPDLGLILWGKIAETIENFPEASAFSIYKSEHPYNQSFIHNQVMQQLFQPLQLLST